jgi:hypothetical protein
MQNKAVKSILYALILIITLCNALTSFFSDSEFWPVTVSKQLLGVSTLEVSLYFKPTFHALLAGFHLLPIDSWAHILLARGLFAFIVFGQIYFVGKIIHIFQQSQKNKVSPPTADSTNHQTLLIAIATIILFLSPMYFNQSVKIRSDHLATFIALLSIYLILSRPPLWSSRRIYYLVLCQLLLFGSTPRAFALGLMVCALNLVFYWSSWSDRKIRKQLLIVTCTPLIILFFLIAPLFWQVIEMIKFYFLNSFSEGFSHFQTLINWWHIEPQWIVMALCFWLFSFYKKQLFLFLPGLFVCINYSLADLKTPFLLASLMPFMIWPAIYWLSHLGLKHKKYLFALVVILVIPYFWTSQRSNWWSTHRYQKEVLVKTNKLLKDHPDWIFFDGMGYLPRANQILSYVGPNDYLSVWHTKRKYFEHNPTLVLYTSRLDLLGDDFRENLLSRYRAIGPNLFLRNDVLGDYAIDFKYPPNLLFHLYPLIK